jgi:hypothetical protein
MRFHVARFGVAVAALAAVACGDQQDRPAQSEAPLAPVFAAQGGTTFSTKCSFTTASQLAGSYFTNNDTTKLVRSLITSMKSAGAGTATARNLGFDVFVHVSTNVAANPDAVTGSAFVNEIIKCMFTDASAWPASYTATAPGPEDFTVALDAAQNGAFQVRGGLTDSPDAVRARLDGYSAVAPPSGFLWSTVLSGNPLPSRVLLYGRPSVAQVGVDPNTFYNWRVVARNTVFTPAVLVGVCVDPNTNPYGNDKAVVRRQDNAGISFLPFADAYFMTPGSNCDEHQVVSIMSPLGQMAAGFMKLGSTLFGARPLQASGLLNPGGLAGATGGIHTDYGPDFVDSVFLSFVVQPHDAKVCTAAIGSGCTGTRTISPVTVLATWRGFPVGGVQITVVPVNNNGTPAEMRGDSTLVTGEDGTVTYTNLGLTKTGGYALLTNAELVEQRSAAIVIPHITSTKFNIRP